MGKWTVAHRYVATMMFLGFPANGLPQPPAIVPAPPIETAVKDFTIRCDGKVDIGPALQRLADHMGPGLSTQIELPAGECQLDSPVVFRDVSPTLRGQGFTEGPGAGMGTWIVISRAGFTPFTFMGARARGAVVMDIGIREVQPAPKSNWAPIDYDFVFRINDTLGEVTFDHVLFAGVTRGIFDTNSGRLNIRSILGQFYRVGLEIDECYDIPRIDYAHFWPYVSSDLNVLAFQEDNLDAIVMRRVDGIYLGDIFSLGSRSVLHFATGAHGVTTKAYVSNLYADFTRYGIWIEGDGTTAQVSNATTQHNAFGRGAEAIPGGIGLLVDAANTVMQVGNWRSDLVESNAIKINKFGNVATFGTLWINNWNSRHDVSTAVFLADSGKQRPNTVEVASTPLFTGGEGGPIRNRSNGVFRQALMRDVAP